MTTSPIETFKMETNFEGLIQLLAKHLYPEPDVFVRELVQNAHDAIQRRRLEVERDHSGRIDILRDPSAGTITFRDNGIGMNADDIKEFLSVIGSTGTGTARQNLQDRGLDLIGQFGIGMLSAFVVADKIVVKTLKYGETQAFAWHNTGSADCILYPDDRTDYGSDVIVFVRPEYSFMLDEERLRKTVIKYCDFVQFPINLDGHGPVNTINAPWHRERWFSDREKDAEYTTFLNRRYPDMPLDVIPIEVDEPYKARGALYISDRHIPDVNTVGVLDIYVRRIFIRASDNAFLPVWAKFVRGVIDSPDLQPTAARDNIQRDHDAFKFLQKYLGDLIVSRLSYLAQNEPGKFERINLWHHYHLKGMAYYYDDFFEKVADLLLFETNKGRMSLKTYLAKNAPRPEHENKAPIYYFAYHGAAAQFYRLADARGWVVINGGQSFDEELLEEYAKKNHHTVHIERLDASDDPALFQRPTAEEQEKFHRLELELENNLHRFGLSNVLVQLRRYEPADLPAIILVTKETEAQERLADLANKAMLFGVDEITEDVVRRAHQRSLYLSINVANPLIQQLASLADFDRMAAEIMRGLYNSAIMYSHNLLTEENAQIIHEQFVGVLRMLIDFKGQLAAIEQERERLRQQMIDLRHGDKIMDQTKPEHILIFMITPFSVPYQKVETAVRRVFERSPYFFEVQLARDYTFKAGLLDNVREHMNRSHGFVAEISDLNPNVMFELGAAMLHDDGRPVFSLRRSDAQQAVPADLKEKLFIPYGSLEDPIETIETAVRAAFERDGRPVHESITALMQQRKKRFLSRTLLTNLRVRLEDHDIAAIMGKYKTVEDVLAVSADVLGTVTRLESYVAQAVQGELRKME